MFIRGTIEYTGELVGLLLPFTSFSDLRTPVTRVKVSCDGRRAEVTAHLGP